MISTWNCQQIKDLLRDAESNCDHRRVMIRPWFSSMVCTFQATCSGVVLLVGWEEFPSLQWHWKILASTAGFQTLAHGRHIPRYPHPRNHHGSKTVSNPTTIIWTSVAQLQPRGSQKKVAQQHLGLPGAWTFNGMMLQGLASDGCYWLTMVIKWLVSNRYWWKIRDGLRWFMCG